MQILIPAKSTSTRIPHKNMRPLAGKPLIWWTLEKCRRWLPGVPVWVATDDLEILKYARSILDCRHYPLTEDDVQDRRNVCELTTEFASRFPSTERILGMHVTSPFTLRSEVLRMVQHPGRMVQTGFSRVIHRPGDLTLSQDIRSTECLTGNLFAVFGQGTLTAEPETVPVRWLSALDINTPEDFAYADRLASVLGFDWLEDCE